MAPAREDQMFNNLIESSSHTREFKRRGSFFLFTTAAYALLFAAAGVASIYAYDAHLDDQTAELEVVTFVPPTEVVKQMPADIHRTSRADNTSKTNSQITQLVRTIFQDRPHNPMNVGDKISVTAPSIPPAPRNAVIGPRNLDPLISGNPETGTGSEGNGPQIAHQMHKPRPEPPA